MKKLLMVATAAFLFTGVAFAFNGGGKKKCAKGKECCKTEAKGKEVCKTEGKEKSCCKKDAKTTTAKTEAKKS
ncbi:MAG: hypothetical protein MUE72_08965 [Chitinophagaceae bacterium]|jgi:hypothetical protein|nr:hypothetical protein [Chitinophagaceae bacterium]